MKINKVDKEIKNLCIFVGNICNLSCEYCYLEPIINSREDYKKKMKVSNEVIEKGLSVFFSFDTLEKKRITFTGGESFLYLDVIENTLNYLLENNLNKKKKLYISINTNGMFLDDDILSVLKKIVSNDIMLSLNISLDGDFSSSMSRFEKYDKNHAEEMYNTIILNIKKFKNIFKENVHINISNTFSSKTYKNVLKNFLYLTRNDIGNHINGFSLRASLGDMERNNEKVAIVKKSFITIKKLQVTYPEFKKSSKSFETKQKVECILNEIVLAPDGNFYKCEFLVGNNNVIIGDMHTGINEKFLGCTFDAESDICKYEQCVGCGTYCQNDMKIIGNNLGNKIYLQEVMNIVSAFYNSMR